MNKDNQFKAKTVTFHHCMGCYHFKPLRDNGRQTTFWECCWPANRVRLAIQKHHSDCYTPKPDGTPYRYGEVLS